MARLVERWHNRCTKFGQRFAQAWFSGHWSVKRSNGAHRIEWNDYLHKYWNRRNRVNTDKASATHRIDWAEHLYKYWNRHMQANNDKTSKASEEDYGDTLSDNRSVNWTWSVTFEFPGLVPKFPSTFQQGHILWSLPPGQLHIRVTMNEPIFFKKMS